MSSASIKGIIGVSQSVTGALNNTIVRSSGGGTGDYLELTNKPSINGVSLVGNKTLDQLGIQAKGDYANTSDIPTKVSQLSNDKNYLTSIPSEYVTESELNNAISNLGNTSNISDNYSREEQVIGTWINGKPIYKKTLEFNNMPINNNNFAHNIDNLDIVVNLTGTFRRADGIIEILQRHDASPNWTVYIGDITNTDINITIGDSYQAKLAIANMYLTLLYTKTTD